MYLLGVDIGGTTIKAGVVTDEGKILLKKECATQSDLGFYQVMHHLKTLVLDLLYETNLSFAEVKSMGVGIPSFVNHKGEVTCVNLGWNRVPIVKILKELFPTLRIVVENDATVAAIAESRFGSMRSRDVAVMLTLGTGVGGGIIINGRPFVGAHGMASEMGHVIIGKNHTDCKCGNNGCFETFCSATAIIQETKRLLSLGEKGIIYQKCCGDLNQINAKMVFDAYREQDSLAKQIIDRFKSHLAVGIAGIVNTLDPHVIALGGGVSRAGDIILEGLEEQVRQHILYKDESFAELVVATLGNDAGIIGAAAL